MLFFAHWNGHVHENDAVSLMPLHVQPMLFHIEINSIGRYTVSSNVAQALNSIQQGNILAQVNVQMCKSIVAIKFKSALINLKLCSEIFQTKRIHIIEMGKSLEQQY